MDHFSIVQALCRVAVPNASPALRKQIERLRDALAKDGDSKHSAALTSILTTADRTTELSPSRIERSKFQSVGEALTRNTPIPVDRETAAALADVVFPADIQPAAPLFNATVTEAIGTIIEEWANFDALSEIDIRPSNRVTIHGGNISRGAVLKGPDVLGCNSTSALSRWNKLGPNDSQAIIELIYPGRDEIQLR